MFGLSRSAPRRSTPRHSRAQTHLTSTVPSGAGNRIEPTKAFAAFANIAQFQVQLNKSRRTEPTVN